MQVISTTSFKEIQDRFLKAFLGLKIEFFQNSHSSGEGSPNENIIEVDQQIRMVKPGFNKAEMVMTPSLSVAEVEANMEETLGITTQVYREIQRIMVANNLKRPLDS
jgi:hypothetical protein